MMQNGNVEINPLAYIHVGPISRMGAAMLPIITSWVRKNVLSPKAQDGLLNFVAKANEQKLDCHALIGAKLMKKKCAYLVHFHAGEFFVFALTEEQAICMNATGVNTATAFDSQRIQAGPTAKYHLESLALNEASRQSTREPIVGSCLIRHSEPLGDQVCLKLEISLLNVNHPTTLLRIRMYAYPHMIQSGQILPLSFSPITPPGEDVPVVAPQVGVAFLSVCIQPNARMNAPAIPAFPAISNPRALTGRPVPAFPAWPHAPFMTGKPFPAFPASPDPFMTGKPFPAFPAMPDPNANDEPVSNVLGALITVQ